MPAPWIRCSDEVAAAVAAGRPVVALESTLIAHGLPFPASRDTAADAEAAVRAAGAVPATIAVLDGGPDGGPQPRPDRPPRASERGAEGQPP